MGYFSGRRVGSAIIALLLFAVAVLSIILASQTTALRAHQKQERELKAKAAAASRSSQLDLQRQCATQSVQAFQTLGYAKEPMAGFSNHYNVALNKCFIQIDSTVVSGKTVWQYKMLFDAFEHRAYGEYTWHTHPVKKYWEVRPIQCSVTLPSGQKNECTSSDEFDALIKPFMEN